MEAKFNKTGTERKALVKGISEILKIKPKYLGMPSAAYEVGDFIINKEGTVKSENSFALERLIHSLIGYGFKLDDKSKRGPNVGLTVAIPKEKINIVNLNKILENKGNLIKKALEVNSLNLTEEEEKINFPWFKESSKEHLITYSRFIEKLCKMSISSKRINNCSKEAINEKYAFRCFLLRLGYIGDEYKEDRKILLEKLSGSSAFRNGGYQDGSSK